MTEEEIQEMFLDPTIKIEDIIITQLADEYAENFKARTGMTVGQSIDRAAFYGVEAKHRF